MRRLPLAAAVAFGLLPALLAAVPPAVAQARPATCSRDLFQNEGALRRQQTRLSAVANAEHNHALDADELFVAEAFADEGPTLKRYRPRARGRATRILKRTSHITIVVADKEEEEVS